MKKQHLNKISAVIPETAHGIVKQRLHALNRLVTESETVTTEISELADKLREEIIAAVSPEITQNEAFLQKAFKKSGDVIFFEFATFSGVKVLLVYIEGLVDKVLLGRNVVNSFVTKSKELNPAAFSNAHFLKSLLSVSNVSETGSMSVTITTILNGNTVMFVDGCDTAFLIDSKGWKTRAVAEPDTEAVIRGPREGFIEDLRTNTSLLRRKIKTPDLVFENINLGKQTKTDIAIAYIDGIVNQSVLKEVRKRLNQIDTDSILETGYIEQFMEDSPFSPLATVTNTQKPDILAAKILEGRVAIFCDGTPHVLTVPHLFIESLQTSEDYYVRPFVASAWRSIRVLSLFFSILVPGLYVALQTYHQEMIPTILLLRMAGSISDIPFPAGAEMFIMLIFYELLRESGVRLPRAVGSAISIVGALIVGESAVNAGLVSAPVVIVTAVTGVASFIVPALAEATMFYRFAFVFAGTAMGLYGIVCGILIAVMHATSLRSFGVPYTSPLAPSDQGVFKDFIFRSPLRSMRKRPEAIVNDNTKRRG